jgi:acetyl-CoA carboxylase biotin carboxyl carrier protein
MPNKKTENANPRDAASRVDLGEVARILDFMKEQGLEELEYQRGDLRVRLRRQGAPVATYAVPAAAVPAPRPSAPAAPVSAAATAPAPAEPAAPAENLHVVKSPIVGTFYSSPSPDTPPFVKLGDAVKPGQVLCIVEAMKLMNEIEADQDGEVARLFVESGQPVEYGQPLFALRPLAGS